MLAASATRAVMAGAAASGARGSGVGASRRRATRKLAVDVGGGEQAEVADLDEAAGQDVEQEAADEFVRGERDGGAVLGGEGDAAFVEAAQALVGDADAVGIAAEVLEDLLGAAEGRLAVDDPVLLVQRVLPTGEGDGVGEVGARAVEVELAALAGAGERGEELAAKERADDSDGK